MTTTKIEDTDPALVKTLIARALTEWSDSGDPDSVITILKAAHCICEVCQDADTLKQIDRAIQEFEIGNVQQGEAILELL